MLPDSDTPTPGEFSDPDDRLDDGMIDPIWTVYFDGRPLEVNRAFGGYTLEEWRYGGKAFYRQVYTPESYQRIREITRQMRITRRPHHNVEVALRAKNGSRLFHFLVNYRPLLGKNGELVGMRGDARNITDLREAQDSFGRDISLLSTLIQNSPDVIWVANLNGQPGYANRGLAGFSAAQWAHGGIEFLKERLTLEARRRFERAVNYLESSGESVRALELELSCNKEARTVRLLATFSPLFGRDGSVTGVQGILHDVSELMLTRKELHNSDTRFRELIENAHDLVWTVDQNGCWVYLNQAAAQFYGRAPEEMIGRPFIEATHPDHREKDLRTFQEVLRGREIVQYETVHLQQNGSLRYLSFNMRPRLDENWEITGAMGMARDMTEQKLYQHQLEHLADHDVLTGLHNRHYFEKELERAVAQVARSRNLGGLLYIDVDNFKYVNDTLGHAAGDRLLLQVAQMLLGRLRQGDVMARFGGDEFTVLLQNMNPTLLAHVAESFHKMFDGFTFVEAGQVYDIRVSLGATLITPDTLNSGEVLAQADLACSLAKTRGRNQAHLYNPVDKALAGMVSDVSWTRKINEALEQDRFVLHFQPIFSTNGGSVEHYEVLLRMRDADGNLIAPGLFLPAAERFGLIHAIDRWVVLRAIRNLWDHQRQGRTLRFAINLSGRVFDDKEFLPFLRDTLASCKLDPSCLTFEITETAAISHMATAREFIESLKSLHCRVALDDFGSGFSSYGYLKHLPVDYLKIDGSFVQHLAREPQDQAIVRSMNQVAHALGKQTIAEFVEDAATLELLREFGVDFAQGYHLGKPSDKLATDG